jgi:hypothetical protein
VKEWSEAEQRAIVDAATILVANYGETEAVERTEGALWYPERWVFCERLWPEHPERIAIVLAALSPRTGWDTTQAWATKLVGAFLAGHECPDVGTMAMRDKAWRAMQGESVETILPARTSPKTYDFYLSILGRTDRPVIDRWAARAAGFALRDNQGLQPRQYHLLSAAYVLAARLLNVTPRYLQATLWIWKRGSGE